MSGHRPTSRESRPATAAARHLSHPALDHRMNHPSSAATEPAWPCYKSASYGSLTDLNDPRPAFHLTD